MGLAILQSCDVRTMTTRSVLMGHEAASTAKGQTTQAKNFADVLEAINKALANQICSKAKISPEAYLKQISGGREWWMNSPDALKAGFIDFEVESLQEAVLVSQVNQAPETSPAPAPADAGVK
jgi:ATP-dependent protease ClpP protease subunit